MENLALSLAIARRFRYFERLAALDRRGMHLADTFDVGRSLGMSDTETERVVTSLEDIGWLERCRRDDEDCVALTVTGLARR